MIECERKTPDPEVELVQGPGSKMLQKMEAKTLRWYSHVPRFNEERCDLK